MQSESKISVLVLYTIPRTSMEGGFMESEAGVLDEVSAVTNALVTLGIANRAVGVKRLSDLSVVLSGADETVVFNLIEGFWDNSHEFNFVPAVVHAFGKACTGNDTNGMLLSLDKWQTKVLLQSASLPCPYGVKINQGDSIEQFSLPNGMYIVKPCLADASEGIDEINVASLSSKELKEAVLNIHEKMKQPVLVEQYIEGRELNISVIWEKGQPRVLPLAEIIFKDYGPDNPRVVGYKAKWDKDSFEYNNTVRSIPAELPEEVINNIKSLAILACRALGCIDYCRVDFRLDENLNPYILEVNANPDISPDAGFVAALFADGLSFDAFIRLSIDNALFRQSKKEDVKSTFLPKNNEASANDFGVNNIDSECSEPRIRWCEAKDRDSVVTLLASTKFFRLDEIDIAKEVLDAGIKDGIDGHYRSYVIEYHDKNLGWQVAGWTCFGPTPCTVGSFDLYWIAVSSECQGQGLGKRLMHFAEFEMERLGGRLSIIETSSREIYHPTRAFYEGLGYVQNACIPDFYDVGDNKVVFTKSLYRSSFYTVSKN